MLLVENCNDAFEFVKVVCGLRLSVSCSGCGVHVYTYKTTVGLQGRPGVLHTICT